MTLPATSMQRRLPMRMTYNQMTYNQNLKDPLVSFHVNKTNAGSRLRAKKSSIAMAREGREGGETRKINRTQSNGLRSGPVDGGGGVLPYKGSAASQGMVLLGFCLKQGIDFIIFSILSIFVLKGYLFLTIKQPARMFYELNYSKIYKIFRVKCPKQGIKILSSTPPHPRIGSLLSHTREWRREKRSGGSPAGSW